MELRQLEAFAAVISTGSITAAGRLLSRSQPAVTRQIQELEAEIGYELLIRNGPKVSPSEKGYQFYQEVEPALLNLRQVRERAREIEQEKEPAIRIAATPALAAGLPSTALARWCQPDTELKIRSLPPERVVQGVQNGLVHVGVNSLPLEHQGLRLHWLGQASCVMAVHRGDPLAQLERIPLEACAGKRLVAFENPYRARGRVSRTFAEAGLSTAGLIESNVSINILMAVRAGLGIAIIDPVTAYSIPLPEVVVRPIDIDIPFLFGAITPERTRLRDDVSELIEIIATEACRIVPGFHLHAAKDYTAVLERYSPDAPFRIAEGAGNAEVSS